MLHPLKKRKKIACDPQSSPSEPPPLAAGVTLYDVEFDFNHFRFVRLSSTGSLASMFEVKSVLIRNYDEDTMTREEDATNHNVFVTKNAYQKLSGSQKV